MSRVPRFGETKSMQPARMININAFWMQRALPNAREAIKTALAGSREGQQQMMTALTITSNLFAALESGKTASQLSGDILRSYTDGWVEYDSDGRKDFMFVFDPQEERFAFGLREETWQSSRQGGDLVSFRDKKEELRKSGLSESERRQERWDKLTRAVNQDTATVDFIRTNTTDLVRMARTSQEVRDALYVLVDRLNPKLEKLGEPSQWGAAPTRTPRFTELERDVLFRSFKDLGRQALKENKIDAFNLGLVVRRLVIYCPESKAQATESLTG